MTTPSSKATTESLDAYGSVNRLCSLCSWMCRHSCPTHLVTRSDACSPTGRALIIELYRGGKSAFTEAAVNRLYQCNLCSACRLWCKPQHDLPRIIELARERIVQEHRAPKGLLDLDEIVTTHGNVYGEPTSRRFTIPKSESYPLNKNAHVLYFVGCTTSYRHPEIAKATVKILTRLGIKVSLLTGEKSEVCCGSPLIRAGFTDNAKALAKQNI
ncbi:MAG: (Fe-S)-binding protein, partial [Promethearchaeota archaeon]